jgi:hypothetical protein
MKRQITTRSLLVITLLISFAACAPQPQETDESPMASEAEEAMGQAVMEMPDTTGASLWSFLQHSDYQATWPLWPGKGRLYEGKEPHGMLLTTYVNPLALGAVNAKAGLMPDGATIVKENYTPDSVLAAVTVMYKVEGYNPEHNDWFFAKFLPSGELEMGPNEMPLEGRVAGCQSCHGEQKDNDYLFTGEIR